MIERPKALGALLATLPAMAAVLASFGIVYEICVRAGAGPSPAILAAALCVGVARRPEAPSIRAFLIKLGELPLVVLGAGLAGVALLRVPVLGAILFAVGIALSVLLRQYGERAAALGRSIALPFMTILVVPVRVEAHDPVVAVLLAIVAGAVAVVCSALASLATQRFAISRVADRESPPRLRPPKPGSLPVATRMALQMLVALALAFVVGLLAFPAHWPWIVLSAFIVTSGAIGRGDAIYKALLRFGGAIGGTLVAALVAHVAFPTSSAFAAAVFAALFIGMWLRQINYAYWAACATLIFALLQGANGIDPAPLFVARVVCIFIGAACGIAATWFVFPIRTEQVVRRRIGDALGAMRGFVTGETQATDDERRTILQRHADELERVAPPVRLHRAVFGARNPQAHPATWIDRAHALLACMHAPDYDRKRAGAEMRELRDAIAGEPPVPKDNG